MCRIHAFSSRVGTLNLGELLYSGYKPKGQPLVPLGTGQVGGLQTTCHVLTGKGDAFSGCCNTYRLAVSCRTHDGNPCGDPQILILISFVFEGLWHCPNYSNNNRNPYGTRLAARTVSRLEAL